MASGILLVAKIAWNLPLWLKVWCNAGQGRHVFLGNGKGRSGFWQCGQPVPWLERLAGLLPESSDVNGNKQYRERLWKMLCKQYLTTFDKVKITGISLIKSVNNNYWLLPQDRIRQCWRATGAVLWILHWNGRWFFIARFVRFREKQCVKLRGLGLAPIMQFLDYVWFLTG